MRDKENRRDREEKRVTDNNYNNNNYNKNISKDNDEPSDEYMWLLVVDNKIFHFHPIVLMYKRYDP